MDRWPTLAHAAEPDKLFIAEFRHQVTRDFPFDAQSSLWIMNRDGSGLHKLADDAGRPAWGQTPAPLTPRVYLPLLKR